MNDHDLSLLFGSCRFWFDYILVSLPLSAFVVLCFVANDWRRRVYVIIFFIVFDIFVVFYVLLGCLGCCSCVCWLLTSV